MTSRLRRLREWMQRLLGTLRGGRPDDDLEEELRSHAALAAEAGMREHRTIDTALESLRDQRGLPWLDALKSDAIFGWRQICRHRTISTASVLSLGLSIGATSPRSASWTRCCCVRCRWPMPIACSSCSSASWIPTANRTRARTSTTPPSSPIATCSRTRPTSWSSACRALRTRRLATASSPSGSCGSSSRATSSARSA